MPFRVKTPVPRRRYNVATRSIRASTVEVGLTANNPYRMPFLLSADAAARKVAAIVDSGRAYAVFPWQMAIVARLLHVLPNWI